MSTAIDDRVVKLEFDNAQFESNVKTSMSTLDKLKQALKLDGASAGLANVSKATSNTKGLSGLEASVAALEKRFSTLGIVGMRVIQNLTDAAMNLAHKGINTVTNSLVQGGIRRAMNIENARFSLNGLLKDEEKVNLVMTNAMDSVSDTAYGMDQAAMAAAQFASSGVQAGDQMYHSLLAIAGVAAQTNSEYEGVSRIFTTVAGNGRLMGDQLLQLSSRGLNAASTISDYFNKVLEGSVEASDSVKRGIMDITGGAKSTEALIREMTSKGKISFEIFAAAMDDAFGKHAKEADRTFTGSMANVKAALAQIGQKFVSPLIVKDGPVVNFFRTLKARIKEVRDEIDPLANFFTSTVKTIARNLTWLINKGRPIKDFATTFYNAIDSIVNIFSAFGSYLKPFGQAFAEVFPKPTLERVESLSKSVKSFTERLILNEKASRGLKNILVAILTPLKTIGGWFSNLIPIIGKVILVINYLVQSFLGLFDKGFSPLTSFRSTVIGFFNDLVGMNTGFKIFESVKLIFENLVGALIKAKDSFFDFVSTVANSNAAQTFIEVFNSFIETAKGAGLKAVEMIADALDGIAHLELPSFLGFSKGLDDAAESADGFTRSFGGDNGELTGFVGTVTTLKSNIDDLVTTMNNGEGALGKALNRLKDTFTNGIDEILNGNNLRLAITTVFGVLIGLLVFNTNKLVETMNSTIKGGLATIVLGPIMAPFKALSGALGELKKTIKATAIVEYALAIALMAGSLKLVGSMPTEQLLQGATVIVIFAVAVKKLIDTFSGEDFKFNDQFDNFGLGLLSIAGSLIVLAGAIALFNLVGVDKMIEGMAVIVGFLWSVTKVTESLKVSGKQFIGMGLAIIEIATALNMLIIPITILGYLDPLKIMRGLAAVGIALTELAISLAMLKQIGSGGELLKLSGEMILLATAIDMLAVPIIAFSLIGLTTIGEGLMAVASGLLIMISAIAAMSYFGMQATTGVLAFIGLAAGLNILAPALILMSAIPFKVIGNGIGALALALTVLLGAGAVAGLPVVALGLKAISLTLLAMGGGFALAGAGALMFGQALITIGIGLPVLVSGLIATVELLRDAIPKVIDFVIHLILGLGQAIWNGLGIVIDNIIKFAPQIFAAAVQLIGNLIKGFLQILPLLPGFIGQIIGTLVRFIINSIPDLFAAGVSLIGGLINGIVSLIGAIGKLAVDLVMGFIKGLIPGSEKLVEQGRAWIEGFIAGLAEKMDHPLEAFNWMCEDIIARVKNVDLIQVGADMVQGLINGIKSKLADAKQQAIDLANSFLDGLRGKQGLDSHSPSLETEATGEDTGDGFVIGVENTYDKVSKAGAGLADSVMIPLKDGLNSGMGDVESILNEASGSFNTFSNKAKDSINITPGPGLSATASQLDNVGNHAEQAGGKVNYFKAAINGIGGVISDFNASITGASNIQEKYGKVVSKDVEEGDNYFRSLKKQSKATDELTDSTDGLSKSLGGAGKASGGAGKAAGGAASSMDKEKKSAEDLAYAMNYANTVTWEYFENYTKHHDTAEGIQMDMAIAQDAIYKYGEELVRAKAKEDGAIEGGAEALEKMKITAEDVQLAIAEMGKGIADNIEGQMDIFEEFDKKTELTGDQVLANMESQISGVTEWANNMQILAARGIDEGLLQKLGDLGPKGYEKVNAFVQMSDQQLQRANQLYATSLQLPASASTKIVASYALAGVGVSRGFAEGIDQHAGEEESAKMGENSLTSLKDALGEKSPSKPAREMGVNVCVGLIQGLESRREMVISKASAIALALIAKFREVLSPDKFRTIGASIMEALAKGMDPNSEALKIAIEKVVDGILKSFKEGLKADEFIKIGENLVQGIINGIKNKSGDLVATAKKLGQDTLRALKAELKEKSPSKATTEMGEFLGDGLVLGIKNTEDSVLASAKRVGERTVRTMRDAIMNSGRLINDDLLDYSPTITPVLDLSKIQNESKNLLNMLPSSFNINASVKLAEEAGKTLNKISAPIVDPNAYKPQEPTNNNYTFTQNNYSPKALSRLEIYRQTKNQFSAMKGVVTAT